MSIAENYNKIIATINKIASSAGRDPEEIEIVTVSKTFPAQIVQEAIDSDIKLFGENRLQEAKSKIALLKGEFTFHLVGHLQSNKSRDAVGLFDIIHSIDKLSTANKVNREAEKIQKVQKILVQVNTSGEDTKSGTVPEDALDLCREILKLNNLKLLGLMTIGPFTDDKDKIRSSFVLLRKILDNINRSLDINLKELSMGMSNDYQIAVEEGATMIRIGSAIFGDRNY